NPDLEEMHWSIGGCVVLAMGDAGAGAHPLHLAGNNNGAVAQAVPVHEPSFEDIRDDLHLTVAVGGKARAVDDSVLVDDTQRAKANRPGGGVGPKGEAVAVGEPADPGAAARHPVTECDQGCSPMPTDLRVILARQ